MKWRTPLLLTTLIWKVPLHISVSFRHFTHILHHICTNLRHRSCWLSAHSSTGFVISMWKSFLNTAAPETFWKNVCHWIKCCQVHCWAFYQLCLKKMVEFSCQENKEGCLYHYAFSKIAFCYHVNWSIPRQLWVTTHLTCKNTCSVVHYCEVKFIELRLQTVLPTSFNNSKYECTRLYFLPK